MTAPEPSTPPRRPPGTWKIGEISGIDVLVRPSWLLILALIAYVIAPQAEVVQPGLGPLAYVAGLVFGILLYMSVLVHEASHAVVALHYGLPVQSITLHFLGGFTDIGGEPKSPKQEFWVSVVGPLTSIGIGAVCLGLYFVTPHGLIRMTVFGLILANLFVGALNLVPGLPLDGGRVLRAAVWKVTGDSNKGLLVAGWAGRVVAALAMGWPIVSSQLTGRSLPIEDMLLYFVVALFLWQGATAAIVTARVRSVLPQLHARPLARRTLGVPADMPLAEAVRRAQESQAAAIITVTPSGEPIGLVSEAAVLATPEDRRPWVAISTVARQVSPGMILPAELEGEELIRSMQQMPATEYLLVEEDGSVYGVLVAEDVDRAFAQQRNR